MVGDVEMLICHDHCMIVNLLLIAIAHLVVVVMMIVVMYGTVGD